MAGREYFEAISPISEHVLAGGGQRREGVLPAELIPAIATPMTIGFMNEPLGWLQDAVRTQWNLGAPGNSYSGINYPERVTVSTPDHSEAVLRRVGLQAIQVTPTGVDVFMLEAGQDRPRAVRTGNVVIQRRGDNHFNNVSKNLGYELSGQLCRLAMASYYHRATFNEFHD